MKKGQNNTYKKEVFQTGLTERSSGSGALANFLNSQDKQTRINIARKRSKKQK